MEVKYPGTATWANNSTFDASSQNSQVSSLGVRRRLDPTPLRRHLTHHSLRCVLRSSHATLDFGFEQFSRDCLIEERGHRSHHCSYFSTMSSPHNKPSNYSHHRWSVIEHEKRPDWLCHPPYTLPNSTFIVSARTSRCLVPTSDRFGPHNAQKAA